MTIMMAKEDDNDDDDVSQLDEFSLELVGATKTKFSTQEAQSGSAKGSG